MNRRSSFLQRHAPLLVIIAVQCVAANTSLAQDDADRTYRSATGLLNRGMHQLAADEYRSFLTAHPDDKKAPTARYGLAVCLSRMGKHAEACEQLEKIIASRDFEFAVDAALLLGQSQLLSDRATDAVRTLQTFLKEHSEHKQADTAASLLGEAQMRSDRVDDAVKTFAMLAERWPKSAARERADLLWAICDSNAGRLKEASARLDSLRERFPESPSLAQATLVEAQCLHRLGQTDPATNLYRAVAESGDAALRSDATLGLAQLVRAGGKPKDAQRMLERLLAAKPSTLTEVAARLELARCRLDDGDAKAALADLAQINGRTPPTLTDDVVYWSARCEAKLGDYQAAAARLEDCETRFANSDLLPEMMYERADGLSRAGRQADADAALSAFRKRFPDHQLATEALLARATGAYQAGDDATAMRLAKEFLAANPKHPRTATAELVIAECQYRAGAYEDAESAYVAFVKRHPDDANVWHATVRRGLCLARLGKLQEAQAILTPALRDSKAGDPSLRRAAMIALGDGAFAASDWKGAEAWFGAVASEKPGTNDSGAADITQDALLKLGLSMHRQGRAEQAAGVYERLLTEFPNGRHATQASFERGQALLELNRDADAAACFDRVIKAEAGADEQRFTAFSKRHLAAIASRQGRSEEAARLLGEVAATSTGSDSNPQLKLDQGLALLAAGKFAEAEGALQEAVKDDAPESVITEARANLAIAVSRQGRLDDALKLLDESVKSVDTLSAGTRESTAYERASVLRRLCRDADAILAYEEFLAGSPTARLAAHAAIEMAQLHAKAERFDDCLRAVEAANKSAAAAEEATRAAIVEHAMYLKGLSEYRVGKPAQSVRTLTALLKEHPDSPLKAAASLVCGEAMLKTSQAAEAARLFQDVAKISKDADLVAPSLLRLGEACAASQNWTGSEQAFAEFLSKFPDSPVWFQARFGIGWARENQRRHDAALESYREIVGKHDGPTAARAQFQIGECLFAMKKHDEAVKELLRVDILYAYPEWSAAALYEAGRCLREQNKLTEARDQFKQVVQRFPDTNWAKLAGTQIEETRPASLPGRDAAGSKPARTDRAK